MEVKRKKKLYTIFISFLAVFVVQTIVLAAVVFLLFSLFINMGLILPAYYAQNELESISEEIAQVQKVEEQLMPPGCTYGVYEENGDYLYGTFSGEEQLQAWKHKEGGSYQVSLQTFYRFIERGGGEFCVVRYPVTAQFADEDLRKHLPNAEYLLWIMFALLFIVDTIWAARRFGKYITKRLRVLDQVTERIKEENLEFEREYSDIQEIDDVLGSLFRMKEALQGSLLKQWDTESRKREQMAALAHDIKTPLTVIRGNAELISEAEDGDEARGYNQFIIQSVQEIEDYLSVLQEMLRTGQLKADICKETKLRQFADRILRQAESLGKSRKRNVIIRKNDLSGTIMADEEKLYRAVMNVLANAVEHTQENDSIIIEVSASDTEKLKIRICDSGPGFSKDALQHATEQFYQSDKSRHGSNHYGMGLYIAKSFIEQQGGILEIGNSKETKGAEVVIRLRL